LRCKIYNMLPIHMEVLMIEAININELNDIYAFTHLNWFR
jgi:hypothetical protein